MMSRVVHFLMKDAVAAYGLGALGIIAFCGSYTPHTFFLKQIAYRHQKLDEQRKPIPVPENLNKLVEQAFDDMQFSELNRKLTKTFMADTLEFYIGGFLYTVYGIMVGIPDHYRYNSKEELQQLKILVDGKPVDWNSRNGQLLLDSLLLSDDAKKYAIAKHIQLSNNYSSLFNAALPAVLCICVYGCCEKLHSLFNLSSKPVAARIYVYVVVCGAFYLLWSFLNDGMNILYDRATEDAVLKLNRSYIVGGIEYYTKMLQKNKALRSLMKKGEKYYSVTGNEKFSLRQKALPSAIKKVYVEGILKQEYNEDALKTIPLLELEQKTNVFNETQS